MAAANAATVDAGAVGCEAARTADAAAEPAVETEDGNGVELVEEMPDVATLRTLRCNLNGSAIIGIAGPKAHQKLLKANAVVLAEET